MRARFIKSKGATLIEVLVSISIFTIISIPLSMTVISAIANNKKSEDKQYAVVVAQQIIEKLRSNNNTPPNVDIKTDTTYKLSLPIASPSAGHDLSYSVLDKNIGKGFKANVTFERKLPYETASPTSNVVEYDLSILMDSNSIKVTGIKVTDLTVTAVSYPLTNNLIINNKIDNTIELKKDNSTSDVLATYKSSNILTNALIDNIQINYAPDYKDHEIHFENNSTNSLSVYIFRQGNVNENTYINSKGSIKFYDNLSSTPPDVEITNGIYDISVEIYKMEGTNKVTIYSTKTSISKGS